METESETQGPSEAANGAEIEAKPASAAQRAESDGAKPAAAPQPPAAAPRKAPVAAQIDDLFAAVRRLEAFAADEAKRVSGKLVPTVEERAKKNIWFSLLLALGLGLILGIWLTGGRRRE